MAEVGGDFSTGRKYNTMGKSPYTSEAGLKFSSRNFNQRGENNRLKSSEQRGHPLESCKGVLMFL